MRQWMTHIAHALNASGVRLQEKTRASLDMTPDTSMDSAASLSARLRRSLRVTLPVLDSSVLDYMKENGFDHIRDADLYLRLVGVTNFLALQQLARTHEALLVGNEYHARVFNGLPLGTQSEMKLMFQRIVIKPSAAFDVMSSLDITMNIANTVLYSNKVTYSLARDCIRNMIEESIVAVNPGISIAKWKEENDKETLLHNYILDNADYFMTYGIYNLARSWPPKDETLATMDADFSKANEIRTLVDDTVKKYFEISAAMPKKELAELVNIFTADAPIGLLHMSCAEFDFVFSGTTNHISILDNVTTSFNGFIKADTDFTKKRMWCSELMIGYIRLRQFLHVTIYDNDRQADHKKFIAYLMGQEKLNDTQMNDFTFDAKSIGGVQEFGAKMQIVTFGHVFTNRTIQDPDLCQVLAQIAALSNNSVGEWSQIYQRMLKKQEKLQSVITSLKHLKKENKPNYTDKQAEEALSIEVRDVESKFKTNDAYILYEKYFSFRRKNLIYNEVFTRPIPVLGDDDKLYDDTGESESSEEGSDDE